MALSPTEEAQVRSLIAQNPALLNLAASESTIISKLGATKTNLSALSAATSLSDSDIALVRQGLSDKSFALSVLLDYVKNSLGQIPSIMTYSQVSALSSNIGPVIVTDRGGFVWQWVNTAFFTGYRSAICGQFEFGWTPTPLPWQVEAIGGTLNETDHGGLIARFKESGLTVALGSWVAGEYKIADMGGGDWKAPDMRDMFLRATGTDADTANARDFGSWQIDQNKSHFHGYDRLTQKSGFTTSGPGSPYGNEPSFTTASGGAESRPINTAFSPIINL
jgi:hypothetical protein